METYCEPTLIVDHLMIKKLSVFEKGWIVRYTGLSHGTEPGMVKLEYSNTLELFYAGTRKQFIVNEKTSIEKLQNKYGHKNLLRLRQQGNDVVILLASAENSQTDLESWYELIMNEVHGDHSCYRRSRLVKQGSSENSCFVRDKITDVFKVTVSATDASQACHLLGQYELRLSPEEIGISKIGRCEPTLIWPFRFIRKYGATDHTFSLEAGRKCSSGPGLFRFSTRPGDADVIMKMIQLKIGAMKMLENCGASFHNNWYPNEAARMDIADDIPAGVQRFADDRYKWAKLEEAQSGFEVQKGRNTEIFIISKRQPRDASAVYSVVNKKPSALKTSPLASPCPPTVNTSPLTSPYPPTVNTSPLTSPYPPTVNTSPLTSPYPPTVNTSPLTSPHAHANKTHRITSLHVPANSISSLSSPHAQNSRPFSRDLPIKRVQDPTHRFTSSGGLSKQLPPPVFPKPVGSSSRPLVTAKPVTAASSPPMSPRTPPVSEFCHNRVLPALPRLAPAVPTAAEEDLEMYAVPGHGTVQTNANPLVYSYAGKERNSENAVASHDHGHRHHGYENRPRTAEAETPEMYRTSAALDVYDELNIKDRERGRLPSDNIYDSLSP